MARHGTRPRGGATARRTGRPTQPPATAARVQGTPAARGTQTVRGPAAAQGTPAAQGRALARGPAKGRRPVARCQRHVPARTGRCAAPSPLLPGLPRRAVQKPGPVVLAHTAAGGSTGNPALPRPLREAPRGRPRPFRAAEPSRPAGLAPARKTKRGSPARPRLARTTEPSRPADLPPARKTRRGCRARRPPPRTADRGCRAGPDRNTRPGPRTTGRLPPGRGSPAAPRATDGPRCSDLPVRARRRSTGHGRTTRGTRRQAWP